MIFHVYDVNLAVSVSRYGSNRENYRRDLRFLAIQALYYLDIPPGFGRQSCQTPKLFEILKCQKIEKFKGVIMVFQNQGEKLLIFPDPSFKRIRSILVHHDLHQ